MGKSIIPAPPSPGERPISRPNISWVLCQEAAATAALLGHTMGPWVPDLYTPNTILPDDDEPWEDGPYTDESWCAECSTCSALASVDIRAADGDRTNGRALYRPCTGVKHA